MPEISRIKIVDNNTYDIKDSEVRNILDILLGNKESDNESVETE